MSQQDIEQAVQYDAANTAVVIDNILKIIPVFSGEPASNAETELQVFLNISRAYYGTLNSVDQLTFLLFVPKLRLREIPYQICCNKSFSSFEEFQKILSEYYLPCKDLSELTNELQYCQQLGGETTREFGLRVQIKLTECEIYLSNLCKQNATEILEEYQRIAIKTFRRGLSNWSLKCYAYMLEGNSLREIIQKVLTVETRQNQCFKPFNPLSSNLDAENAHSMNEQPNSNPLSLNPENKDIERRPVICYRCGQQNHISKNCRYLRHKKIFSDETKHSGKVLPRKTQNEEVQIASQSLCVTDQKEDCYTAESARKKLKNAIPRVPKTRKNYCEFNKLSTSKKDTFGNEERIQWVKSPRNANSFKSTIKESLSQKADNEKVELRQRGENRVIEKVKLLIDNDCIRKTLSSFNDILVGEEESVWKKYKRTRKKYKWRGMFRDIAKYVKKICEI